MQLKITTQQTNILDAEEELIKALQQKHECKERYSDPAVEQFANDICTEHENLLKQLANELKMELHANI